MCGLASGVLFQILATPLSISRRVPTAFFDPESFELFVRQN